MTVGVPCQQWNPDSDGGDYLAAIHSVRPSEIAKKPVTLAPGDSKEIARGDPIGVDAQVRLDSPAEVRAAPRTQAVSFRKPPRDPQHYFSPGPDCLPDLAGTAGLAKYTLRTRTVRWPGTVTLMARNVPSSAAFRGVYARMYWLRISCAICGVMLSTSPNVFGK